MDDMFFAIKATIITVVLVGLMQIKVGQHTIEQKAYNWIKSSYLVAELNQVSQGAIIAMREVFQGVSGTLSQEVREQFSSSNAPGNRELLPTLKRSGQFLNNLKDQAAESLNVGEVEGMSMGENIKKMQDSIRARNDRLLELDPTIKFDSQRRDTSSASENY
ncbi:MAG: hypothetical protein AB8E15_00530 [Bdellovibrionales bacterium]